MDTGSRGEVVDGRQAGSQETVARSEQLGRVVAKLDRLRKADRAFRVFGAHSHKYRLGRPLGERDILTVERRMGIVVPTDYRLFLTNIGHGGAGRYYGLFRLDGQSAEDITDLAQVGKPFRWSGAANPYDWEDPCSREDVWCDDKVEANDDRQIILNVPGALYVCHYGCAIRFFIIVNGQCIGEVWRDSQTDGTGIRPECAADGRHFGFLDWYENWLDENLLTSH